MTDQPSVALTERNEILVCEHAVWRALVAGDAIADKALLLPGFVGVYPTGFSGRDGHADQLADGPSVANYSISEEKLLVLGPEYRLLIYRADYLRIGAALPEAMYVSSLWQKVEGSWKNLFSQDTPADGTSVV